MFFIVVCNVRKSRALLLWFHRRVLIQVGNETIGILSNGGLDQQAEQLLTMDATPTSQKKKTAVSKTLLPTRSKCMESLIFFAISVVPIVKVVQVVGPI